MEASPPSLDPDEPGHTDLLLGRARSGDQEAWRRLYERYYKMLRAHVEARIVGLSRRPQDAEDLLQIAFMRAWQGLETFEYRGEGSFRKWLARVAVNACLSELEERRTAALQSGALATHDEQQAQRKSDEEERRIAMMEALGELDEDDRDLLIQRIIDDLSFEEIGRNLGCSREQARSLYAAATERLARRLSA
jgi:RNA polymerase sigma-70 factor (ECF subfamily)